MQTQSKLRRLHELLIGVALSGGIRTRNIGICHDQAELLTETRERYLAKECVGSNRALTRTIATSRSDDNQNESQEELFGR